ncbi:hypothetical protein BGW80DRAFT_1463639 [Lactifluus volemus]|nr:hypothetical protein BGW80DRAFT_1463639 [Lactifluus volemus]
MSSNEEDPIRALNNLLQGTNPSLNHFLSWTSEQTGPNHQAWHKGQYTFRGVVVGYGEGLSINQAKYHAAKQALQHFQTHPPT